MSGKHKKPKRFYCTISVERDRPTPSVNPSGLYKIRVLVNHTELIHPLVGAPTFDNAMRSAWAIKGELEKRFCRRIPAGCIKVLKGVEELVDIDPTLKFYLADGALEPCKEYILAKLK